MKASNKSASKGAVVIAKSLQNTRKSVIKNAHSKSTTFSQLNAEYSALAARSSAAVLSKKSREEIRAAPQIAFAPATFILPGQSIEDIPDRIRSKIDDMVAEVADVTSPVPVSPVKSTQRSSANAFSVLSEEDASPITFAPASFKLPGHFSSASLPGSSASAPTAPYAAFHAAFGVVVPQQFQNNYQESFRQQLRPECSSDDEL